MDRKQILSRIQNFHKGAWFKINKKLRDIKRELDKDFEITRKSISNAYFKTDDAFITYPAIYTLVMNSQESQLPENMADMLHSLIYYQQTVKVKKAHHVTVSMEKFQEFQGIDIPKSFPVKRITELLPEGDLFLIVDGGSIYYFTREVHMDGEERVALYRYISDNLLDYYYYNLSAKTFHKATMAEIKDGTVEYVEKHTLEDLLKEFDESYREMGVNIPEEVTESHLNFVNRELPGLINILAYLKSKNVSVVKTDYNPELPHHKEKLGKADGKKKKAILKKIDQLEKFLFVEVDECKYQYKEKSTGEGRASSKKRGHWRKAHFHLYWKGPKDMENREFIIHYIPTLFVGDPENVLKKVEVIK